MDTDTGRDPGAGPCTGAGTGSGSGVGAVGAVAGFAHPLVRWLAGVGEQLDGALECPSLSLPLAEYDKMVEQLATFEAQLASLRLRLTRQAELNGVKQLSGAASTAGWVRERTGMGAREASVPVRLAKALDQGLRATGVALAQGRISLGQALVIERAIRRLPKDLGAEVERDAEAVLLDNARRLDTDDLDKVGRHLYEVIAPEEAERRIGKQLEEQERRAREDRALSFGPVHDGVGTVFMRLDVPTLTLFRTLLDPLARPRPTEPGGPDLRSSQRRQADAFAELLDLTQTATTAPTRGGTRPRLTVTMSYEDLANKLRYGTIDSLLTDSGPTHPKLRTATRISSGDRTGGDGTGVNGTGVNGAGAKGTGRDQGSDRGGDTGDQVTAFSFQITGHPLSAMAVRQLACDAEIIPAVLGGDGAVLDLGRGSRLFSSSQRHALAERDGYFCHFPTCRRPEPWTQAHHIHHWIDGGHTNLDNGVLLCQHHHTLIHTKGWTVRMGNHGHPEYLPPPWIDPHQNPIRPDDRTIIRS
jgi:hypothetical protein